MEFRTAEASDTNNLRRMWEEAFGDEQPWTDWFFTTHHRAENVWVGVKDEVPVAQTHLLPHVLRIRGHNLPVCYIVGVCVRESLRGEGIGKRLMRTAMEEAGRRGFVAGILQPRYPDFYRNLGWDYCCWRRVYRMNFLHQTQGDRLPGQQENSESANLRDIQALADVYDRFTRPLHAYAVRDRSHWQALLADHIGDDGRLHILRCKGVPTAYTLYHVRHGSLVAREIAYVDTVGQKDILDFLVTEANQAGAAWMEWTDPSDSPSQLLPVPILRQDPFLMARLTDPLLALQRVGTPGVSGQVTLEVTDESREEQPSCVVVQFCDGQAFPAFAVADSEPEIRLDAGALTQLLFGYHSVPDLMTQQRLQMTDICGATLLGRAFPVQNNYLGEYF